MFTHWFGSVHANESFQKMKVKQRNDNSCREYRNSGRLNLQVLREVFQIHPFPKTLVLSANIGD